MAIIKLLICLFSILSASAATLDRPTVLKGVRVSSCHDNVCARLNSETVYRSPLAPEVMAFGSAKLVISQRDGTKSEMQFDADDGYYDMQTQVIVLRGLKKSVHRELIYNLAHGRLAFF